MLRGCRGVRIRPWSSCLARRWFAWTPESTNYYTLDTKSDEVLGQPRIESTRLEAAARRIADRFLLYDSVNQALLENEEAEDFGPIDTQALKEFVDAGELNQPHGKTRRAKGGDAPLSTRLHWLLQKPDPTKQSKVLREVAKVLRTRSVHRISTYQALMRRLIIAGYYEPAQIALESLIMTRIPLGWSTLALGLELSVLRGDRSMFMGYSNIVLEGPLGVFSAGGTVDRHKEVYQRVAEGSLRFRDWRRLNAILKRADQENLVNLHLLMAAAECSMRWVKHPETAEWALSKLNSLWDPNSPDVARFLFILYQVPGFKGRAMARVKQMTPTKQKMFWNLKVYASRRYPNPAV